MTTQLETRIKPETAIHSRQQLAVFIDETKLAFTPDEDQEQVIRSLCENALKEQFRAVCVRPEHVKLAKSIVQGSPVRVATVIGFPRQKYDKAAQWQSPSVGDVPLAEKIREMEQTRADGADEYDVVMNLRLFKADREACREEFVRLVEAAKGLPIKLIIETDLLEKPSQVTEATHLAVEAGIEYVKTSTGFIQYGVGAQVEDIATMARAIDSAQSRKQHGIKASGGIRTADQALKLIEAGANIIGTSNGTALLNSFQPR